MYEITIAIFQGNNIQKFQREQLHFAEGEKRNYRETESNLKNLVQNVNGTTSENKPKAKEPSQAGNTDQQRTNLEYVCGFFLTQQTTCSGIYHVNC